MCVGQPSLFHFLKQSTLPGKFSLEILQSVEKKWGDTQREILHSVEKKGVTLEGKFSLEILKSV